MKTIKPTLIINKQRAVNNIRRIKEKIQRSPAPIRFRPHFKTHQSAQVGQWFRDLGITAITVSSVEMALYFAQHQWKDITIAILVNPLEIQAVNQLIENFQVDLGLLVDSPEMVEFLDNHLKHPARVWIKIDTGYHRTGLQWNQKAEALNIVKSIQTSPRLRFSGLLTHSGHSYGASSTEEIIQIYDDTVSKMNNLKDYLKKKEEKGIGNVEISIGDTPTCSVVESFCDINEIRCGNFVFYDVMQWYLGSCREKDIAAAVACPVIARYPQRNEIVIYGGAVHLSKDFVTGSGNQNIFGLAALPENGCQTWSPILENTYVASLSQEHGIIKTHPSFFKQVKVGDMLMILPVHSCLAANLLKSPCAPGGQNPF